MLTAAFLYKLPQEPHVPAKTANSLIVLHHRNPLDAHSKAKPEIFLGRRRLLFGGEGEDAGPHAAAQELNPAEFCTCAALAPQKMQ